MLFCKCHNLERSRSLVKTNATIGFLDLNNMDLDTKIIILSALVEKLWSMSFCKIGANVARSGTSHVQSTHDILTLCKGPDPSYPVLKFGDDCPSSNCDTAPNMILQGHDLKRSKSSVRPTICCKTLRSLLMSIHVKFPEILSLVFPVQ